MSVNTKEELINCINLLEKMFETCGLELNKPKCGILCTSDKDELAPWRTSIEDR